MSTRLLWLVASLCLLTLLPLHVRAADALPIVTLERGSASPVPLPELPALSEGEGLRIAMDRLETRSGERWLRGVVQVAPPLANGTMLRASVFAAGGAKPVGSAEASGDTAAIVQVNLRGAGLDRGRLMVEVVRGGQAVAIREVVLAAPAHGALADGTRIPIVLDADPATVMGQAAAVTFGVPFAADALWEIERLRLVDGTGKALPAQFTPAATWHPDGSIKWARVDALAPPAGEVFVEVAPVASAASASAASAVSIQESGGVVTARVGMTEYIVGAGPSPIRTLRQNGQLVATAEGARGLYVIDQKGRLGTASEKDTVVTVESRGPIEASIRIEGPYLTAEGEELARHVTRVRLFADQPEARVSHTFIVSRDSNEVWFREIGWELASARPSSQDKAVFGTSAEDWKKHAAVPVGAGRSASMAQVEHFRFLQGQNKFVVTAGSGGSPIAQGAECGDWAALNGSNGGFLMGTAEAARRHPKEFVAGDGKLALLLFSPAGGRELDFRSPQVVEDLGLADFLPKLDARWDVPAILKTVSEYPSDARGWAKTHEMVVSPVPANQPVEMFAKPAAALTRGPQAIASPHWLYETRVLGPLHPRDPQRFPEIERHVERSVSAMRQFGHDMGEFGFRDYEAGPHFIRSFDPPVPLVKRWGVSYAVRPDLWYLYARSGDRAIREFAAGSARAFADNHMCNWPAPTKTRGLFNWREGGDTGKPDNPHNLPFYWGGLTVFEVSGTSSLEMFLLDYYLTGNRRTADAVRAYGEGVKEKWQPDQKTWRHLRLYYNLLQAYTLTWDPHLGAIARSYTDTIVDEEGALYLLTTKPLQTSYKTQSDFPVILFAHEVLGDPRLKEMAFRLADYWRDSYIDPPYRYGNPDAPVARFLYEQTGDLAGVENLAVKLRQLHARAVKEKDEVRPFGVHEAMFMMHGFAVAQHLVLETGAWQESVVSAQGLESFGAGPAWYVQKPADQSVTLRLSYGNSYGGVRRGATLGGQLVLRPVGIPSAYNQDLHRVTELVDGAIVEIPKDAPAGVYELRARGEGKFSLVADCLVPLMVAAPGPWQPLPEQTPMPPIFFQVESTGEQPRLSLAGRGRLIPPGGGAAVAVTGSVELPTPGVWELRLDQPAVIRAVGFPPLFAFGRADHLFELPDDAELPTQAPPPFKAPPGGIRLQPKDTLVIEMPETDLPAGTVEFYFHPASGIVPGKPDWKVLTMHNTLGRPAVVTYKATPQEVAGEEVSETIGYQFQTMVPVIYEGDRQRTSSIRGWRRHYFQEGRWNHLAYTWGLGSEDYKKQPRTTTRLHVDGEAGVFYYNVRSLAEPELRVNRIVIGPGLDGTIAGLRLSKTARYLANFDPPTLGGEGWKDAATIAAWTLAGPPASEPQAGGITITKK